MIDWQSFSWDAFATLASGLAAVAAAVVIALRQMAITDRQTSILEKQTKLSEQSLKLALYDKRFVLLESTLSFVSAVERNGAVDDKTIVDFMRAIVESHFLYGKEVHDFVFNIYCHYQNDAHYTEEWQSRTVIPEDQRGWYKDRLTDLWTQFDQLALWSDA